ncbi:MAG: CRTAC1 family protein [Balneolaceae bacterium]|nr:MAG: CRTAC1 family protein [Balneolaceae bacterium]
MKILQAVIAPFLLLLLLSCANKAPDNVSETAVMVARLDSIAKNVDPWLNEFAGRERVAALTGIPVPGMLHERIMYTGTLAQEMIYAGYTEEAIELLENMLAQLEVSSTVYQDNFTENILDLLALAWLRLGEQQNCILNHSSASCLFPIQGDGIHTLPQGSRKAIELLERLLTEWRPGDMESIWLLNIAYMTLGEHPYNVPEQWLIPAELFTTSATFNRFYDIAPFVGLADEMGLSGGSVTEDFTQNGFIDIMASSWGISDQLHYFENTGNGAFVNKTQEAGLSGITGGLNLIHADYNNDGNPDVFVLRGAWLGRAGHHPNSLLRNNGDGTFIDVTESAGLLTFHPTQTAVWADFNNNGWLDLFIGNESTPGDPHPSELYLNNKDGTFTNIAAEAGLDIRKFVKGVTAGDINNNGFPDIYISILGGENLLFENQGTSSDGIPRFREIAEFAGVQEPIESFPTWFWDYNNNGLSDLFVSGYYANAADIALEYLGRPTNAELPRLYRNNGDGTFSDVTSETGLNRVMYTMGSNFGDLDNDGYLDFYVGTGDPDMRVLIPNRMFRSVNGDRFEEVTASGGFGHLQKGHGVSFADLNNNGHQDIFTVIGGALEGDVYMNALFENPGNSNNWITLTFHGVESNRSGIGNRVKITIEEADSVRNIHRTVTTGGSFGSSSLQLEIGLGKAVKIQELEVYWPASNSKQHFYNVPINQFYRVTEFAQVIKPVARESFRFNTTPVPHSHSH